MLGKTGTYRETKVYQRRVLRCGGTYLNLTPYRMYINNELTDRDERMPEEPLYRLVSNLASLKYYFIEASTILKTRESIILPLLSCLRVQNLPSRLGLLPLQLASNVPSLAEHLSVNVNFCLNDCGDGSTNDIQG